MPSKSGDRWRVLSRLDKAWTEFTSSYAGLSEVQLLEPGVTGRWSVRDIIAHVSWWEEEALKHLPLIVDDGRPPRYSTTYGGIDAFNALMTEQRSHLSLAEVFEGQRNTHQRLLEFLQGIPEVQLASTTRFRHRLRLDTYGHYPKHADAVRRWRGRG
jgi:DinB superfamily